jgi:hypothetical protein
VRVGGRDRGVNLCNILPGECEFRSLEGLKDISECTRVEKRANQRTAL